MAIKNGQSVETWNIGLEIMYLQTSHRLLRYCRTGGSYWDFPDRDFQLTRKILNQGFLMTDIAKSYYRKLCTGRNDLVNR